MDHGTSAVSDALVTTIPAEFSGKIVVPYPYESTLSGIRQYLPPGKTLWYHRKLTIPADWSGDSVLLNFGAVKLALNYLSQRNKNR